MSAGQSVRASPAKLAALPRPSDDWDTFVRSRAGASVYHLSGWPQVATEIFGHPALYIEARDDQGRLTGVLPLIRQKSFLIGDFATSLPFFNYGGAECDDEAVATAMMELARDVAREWGCSYVEFRDSTPRAGDWRVRRDKVSMVLDLPTSFEALAKQLGSKLRSQVKRTDREEASVLIGGAELVEPFYQVFAENMRDLGTPVYPRRFFHAIATRFPEVCKVVVIQSRGQPAAAAFLVISQARAEIPWAACLNRAKPLGFNMKLYLEVLRFVIELGCRQFDFGRSTIDAGTYKFKKQWGAQPLPLFWHRWEKHPRQSIPESAQSSHGLMERASALWQRLPLRVANSLGPIISPKLPW